MRWGNRATAWVGQRREVSRFLWWPVTCDGETRWLEYAHWSEEFRHVRELWHGVMPR